MLLDAAAARAGRRMRPRTRRGRGGVATHKSLGASREHSGRKDLLGPHLFKNCSRKGGAAAGRAESKRQGNTGASGREPAGPASQAQAKTRASSAASRSASPAAGPSPSRQPPETRIKARIRRHGKRQRASPRGLQAPRARRIPVGCELFGAHPARSPPRSPRASLPRPLPIPGGFSLSVCFRPPIESLF